MTTLEASKEWATVPWEISGEELPVSPWRKFVWKERRKLYTMELMAKRARPT